ncbi:metabolite drug protein [Babesia ovata]|uniref:Metabolite drug protein n=1 Tax=Babesia ovata TaxID=189622 RepID=A0A2H6KBP5_9APIC|nr:metabolite drug protein [Babesia ovata]GBE60418.1 metabolite drug protein [Babesia ovata]
MDAFTVVELLIWLVLISLAFPGVFLHALMRFYWWLNAIPEGSRKGHPNAMPALNIVFLTDIVQSMLFPTVVDMCHIVMFNDRVFLSWITAVHHLGAAVGGVMAWVVSYLQLDRHFHNVPKCASVLLTVHMVYFLRILQLNSMLSHIFWHGLYYVIYSFHQIAVFNTLVASVGKREMGSYMTLSSAVAKLGNITGPAALIMVSTLDSTSFARLNAPFRLKNAEIAYVVVLALCIVRVVYTFELVSPLENRWKRALDETSSPILPPIEEKMVLGQSIATPETLESGTEPVNQRHSVLPYVIFAMNVLSLIGAGLSIRFMFLYMILKFNMEYRLMWLANICIPIASTAALFVIDNQARRYGKLKTIFVSQTIGLMLLYAFTKVEDPKLVLVIYVLRATFQNTPAALKTTVMLKHSSDGANSYWLASEHVSRVLIFVSTILGGHLSKYAGLEYCFLATG